MKWQSETGIPDSVKLGVTIADRKTADYTKRRTIQGPMIGGDHGCGSALRRGARAL